MPNPYRYHTLSADQATKTITQHQPYKDYIKRIVERLHALKLEPDDPLLVTAIRAESSVIDLSFAIMAAARPPKKTRWE
jgi:hypothetical protein